MFILRDSYYRKIDCLFVVVRVIVSVSVIIKVSVITVQLMSVFSSGC